MKAKLKSKNEKVRGRPSFFIWHFSFLILLFGHVSLGADRVIRARDMTVAPSQTNRLLIALESLGNETALGFSIRYNTNQLRFIQAFAGTDSTNVGASFSVNTNQMQLGRIGLALTLDIFSSAAYPAGTNIIAEIFFSPAPGITSATSTVTFTNQPIMPDVSDANAESLPVSFGDANVFIAMPCAYSLSTNAAAFSDAGGTGSVDLAAGALCSWIISNSNAWIAITSQTNGVGAASVNFSVAANPSSVPRAGMVAIAGQSLTVTQQGVACAYSLSTNAASFGVTGGSGSVNLNTVSDCPWSLLNTSSWIVVSITNGVGSATINYSVATNLNPVARSSTLTIAGRSFTIGQIGITCTYALSPTNRVFSYPAVTNSVSITTSNPCPWSVVNSNSWITILSGSNGVGTGAVVYASTANATSADRNGSLVIGGEVFGLTQHGVGCAYSVSPTKRAHGFGTATNFLTVNASAGCSWIVVNTNSWITITNGSTPNIGAGIGNGTVGYTVDANPFGVERVGVLNVEGATLIITQRATICTYTISPTNRVLSHLISTGLVSVTAGSGCIWTAATTSDWITFTPNTNGSGNGSFGYALLANTNSASRTGAVTVAGQTLTLAQLSLSANFTFQSISTTNNGVMLKAIGGVPGVWELQFSSNLVDWAKLANVTNATGRVDYLAPGASGGTRFYRAVLP